MRCVRKLFPLPLRLLLLMPLVVFTPGCAKAPNADVSGTVRYNDKPLVSGSVVLVGSDGIPRTATIGSDGTFSVTGVPSGEVKVAVVSPGAVNQSPQKKDGKEAKPNRPNDKGSVPKAAPPAGWFAIPKKYGEITTSGLIITINAGPNNQDITLSD